jgi:hypothetical protein
MKEKVRITVLAAGFGARRAYDPAVAGFNFDSKFDKVAPVNMDDIEVPAFLRYRT